jgi:hypothetical protein
MNGTFQRCSGQSQGRGAHVRTGDPGRKCQRGTARRRSGGAIYWSEDGGDVPQLIRGTQLRYLQIDAGSEASCIHNPDGCWVANTRTIWTHLVIGHADDLAKANEEPKFYRNADVTSETAIWNR